MRYNQEDLKSRALVESNILKQFILSSAENQRNRFKPQLDDILIHNYQMANSITLNVILSNYMVDLEYALDCFKNPVLDGRKDSYFKLVRDLSKSSDLLGDQTRLVLDLVDGNGTFKYMDLELEMQKISGEFDGVQEFFNLDGVWYCKKTTNGEDKDIIEIVDGMNDFNRQANPFGCNPFDHIIHDGTETFNDWLGKLYCIVENRFFNTVL